MNCSLSGYKLWWPLDGEFTGKVKTYSDGTRKFEITQEVTNFTKKHWWSKAVAEKVKTTRWISDSDLRTVEESEIPITTIIKLLKNKGK